MSPVDEQAGLGPRTIHSTFRGAMSQGSPARFESHGVTLELSIGDIAAQDGFDAVVNAANAELLPGGGVAGALHRAAGPGLAEEGRGLAPIQPGQAVLTSGHGLANPWVIHCLGPVYGHDRPEDQLLASCYREALRIAEAEGLHAVAFPSLSTGAFGYPMDAAAEVALRAVVEAMPGLRSVRRIRFVLYDRSALAAYERALSRVSGAAG